MGDLERRANLRPGCWFLRVEQAKKEPAARGGVPSLFVLSVFLCLRETAKLCAGFYTLTSRRRSVYKK